MTTDRKFIDAAAKGFEIEAEPFKALAHGLGMTEGEVIGRIRRLIDEGKVRRFAASVRHQPLGYTHNAMVIARVNRDDVEDAGKAGSGIEAVSHCYQRPHPDGDPWCLYMMVHGKESGSIDQAVKRIQGIAGVREIEVCRSIEELKKTSLSGVSTRL
jgi:DNA-binding Lrp family transcriptional regulator